MKNKDKKNIVNIIGIDGSGKTTLANALLKHFTQKGIKIQLIYCQYFAWLLYPIRKNARQKVMKDIDEFADYKSYRHKKVKFAKKHNIAIVLYVILWLIDYSMQVIYRLSLRSFRYDIILVDRYLYDIVVNRPDSHPASFA